MLILIGIFGGMYEWVASGWQWTMFGLVTGGSAIGGKLLLEQQSEEDVTDNFRQLEQLRLQLAEAKRERDELDAELPAQRRLARCPPARGRNRAARPGAADSRPHRARAGRAAAPGGPAAADRGPGGREGSPPPLEERPAERRPAGRFRPAQGEAGRRRTTRTCWSCAAAAMPARTSSTSASASCSSSTTACSRSGRRAASCTPPISRSCEIRELIQAVAKEKETLALRTRSRRSSAGCRKDRGPDDRRAAAGRRAGMRSAAGRRRGRKGLPPGGGRLRPARGRSASGQQRPS